MFFSSWGALLLTFFAARSLRRVRIPSVVLEAREASETVLASGQMVGERTIPLSFNRAGRIAEELIKDGDRVKAGQALMRQDTAIEETVLAQRRSALAAARLNLAKLGSTDLIDLEQRVRQAKASADYAAVYFKRQAELLDKGSITPLQFDQVRRDKELAESALVSATSQLRSLETTLRPLAEIQVAQAENDLQRAEIDLRETVLRAPLDGRIVEHAAHKGEFGTSGAKVITFIPASERSYVEVQVEEASLARLAIGQKAAIASPAFPGRTYPAAVERIAPIVDTQRGTFALRLMLDGVHEELLPESSVSVQIVVGSAPAALLVEQRFLVREGGAAFVYAADGGRARRIEIKADDIGGGLFAVASGLKAGDRILLPQGLKEGKTQTVMILVGITLGIAVQVFLNSLIVDLQRSLVEDTVGRSPHITAEMPDAVPAGGLVPSDGRIATTRIVTNEGSLKPIRNWRSIDRQLAKLGAFKAINPVAQGSGFILQGDKSLPVILRGFDLERADALYDIRRRLVAGRYEVGGNGILIGRQLSERLRTGVGDTLRIIVPSGAGDVFPIYGVFDLENKSLNESWVIISLGRAQILYGLDQGLTQIELQVPDVFTAKDWAADLRRTFPGLEWLSWQETNAQLLAALQGQGSSSYLIQLFVLLSVTLAIASVLAISVVQRSRQIGILKALGMKTRQISRVFIIQGGILGFLGSLLGGLAGWGMVQAFVLAQKANPSASLDVITVRFGAVVLSVLIATAAGTLAAFVPARRAARLNPIEVIRNG